jgi:hypothetical protein
MTFSPCNRSDRELWIGLSITDQIGLRVAAQTLDQTLLNFEESIAPLPGSQRRPRRRAMHPAEKEETTMKVILAGIVLATAMLVASAAFTTPFCPGGTWKDGRFVCVSVDDNQ